MIYDEAHYEQLRQVCLSYRNDAERLQQENEQLKQQLAELEKANKRLNTKLEIWNRFDKEDYIHRGEKATERDYYYYTNGVSAVLENEVERLNHDLAVRDKALELAVEEILINKNEFYSTETYYTNGTLKAKLKQIYFISQAEKELKGESDE